MTAPHEYRFCDKNTIALMLSEIYADRQTLTKNFGNYQNKTLSKPFYIMNVKVSNATECAELEEFLDDWVDATNEQSHFTSYAPVVKYHKDIESIMCYIRRYTLSANIVPVKTASDICDNPTEKICRIGIKKAKTSLMWGDVITTNNPYKVATKKTET